MSRRLGLLVAVAILAIVAWPATCDAIASVAVAAPADAASVPASVERSGAIDRSAATPSSRSAEVRVSHIASATALRTSPVLLAVLAVALVLFGPRPRSWSPGGLERLVAPRFEAWAAPAPPRAPPVP